MNSICEGALGCHRLPIPFNERLSTLNALTSTPELLSPFHDISHLNPLSVKALLLDGQQKWNLYVSS